MANSIEVQVSLGLQAAQQQIQQLHKVLEQSVKLDSSSFKSIQQILNQVETAADKLAGKLNTAFKTSNTSKSFLLEYEKMLEALSTAQQKMGNLGFQDIQFSVKDQEVVDNAVKRMQELETTLNRIQSGKAIDIINLSSVDGIENLREQITGLNKDVSNMSFEKLTFELTSKMDSVKTELDSTREKVQQINNVISKVDASGLENVKNALSGSEGIALKINDFGDVDKVNQKLNAYIESLNLASQTAKTFHANDNVAKFIKEQTEALVNAYTDQINTVNQNKKVLLALISDIDNAGRVSSVTGRKLFNKSEVSQLIDSQTMQQAIKDFNIQLEEGFSSLRPEQQVAKLKAKIKEALADLGKQEDAWNTARADIANGIQSIFEGLGEQTITNVTKFKKDLKDAIVAQGIDLKELKFDFNGISTGNLGPVLENLKFALADYIEKQREAASATENNKIPSLEAAYNALKAAIETATKAQAEQDSLASSTQHELDATKQKIIDLVNEYNKLSSQKITLNINNDNLNKAKSSIQSYIESISKLESKQKALSNVQSAVTRWMGFYQVLNLTKRAINDMKQHIQELDAVMTKIAVVTNMSQNDLWRQIGTYSEIARQYGVAIKGVYEVSQIYYQQGLNKGDVMTLTTETLKMARIAGIDYATAADYMTTAIRGFKMEMTDAAHVTDVFSALAASTASNTEELATAISKTAASAANVGASFEATSAMMATMIATTRESATNIGTALKSIIARYGELKENVTGVDAEGEEYSLNKVDKALQTVGVSIHDANGEFRDFDDVILELAESWDTIDKNTQRYIATVMAGNRQQSRFLALVSNVEEYKRALEIANEAEGAGEVQVSKTLDSIDAKIERMKVTIQEFYTSSGIQDLYKGILDTITDVISAANKLPKIFGNFPAIALGVGLQLVSVIKNILSLIIVSIQSSIESVKQTFARLNSTSYSEGRQIGQQISQGIKDGMQSNSASMGSLIGNLAARYGGALAQLVGSTLTINGLKEYGASTNTDTDIAAGKTTLFGGILSGLGGMASSAATGFATGGGIPGAVIGGIVGIASSLPTIISSISMLNPSLARIIELDEKAYNDAKSNETEKKGSLKELDTAYEKLESLEAAAHESAEAMQEYHEYMNQLSESYPELISSIELSGDKIITLADLEIKLANARTEAIEATIGSVKSELQLKKDQQSAWKALQNDTANSEDELQVSNYFLSTMYKRKNNLSDNAFVTSYQIFEMYNEWAKQYNSLNLNTDKVKIMSDEQMQTIRELPQFSNAYFQEFQEGIIKMQQEWLSNDFIVSNLLTEEDLQRINNTDNADLKSGYRKALEQIHEAVGANYSDLTNGAIKELDDIISLDSTELIAAIKYTNQRASQYANVLSSEIADLGEYLKTEELTLQVQNAINKQSGQKAKTLNNYSSFITGLIAREHYDESNIDWNTKTDEVEQATENWYEWILKHQEEADWLIKSLDFSKISNGNLTDILKEKGIDDENIIASYEADYTEYFKTIKTGFTDALNVFFAEDSFNYKDLFIDLFDGQDNDLAPATAQLLQSKLKNYQKLISKGYTIGAENYLESLYTVFSELSTLSDDQFNEISSIIYNIDFEDSATIDTAIKSLGDLGPEYTSLITALTNAENRLILGVKADVVQLQEALLDQIKNIEKVTDNLNKGTKYSEALSNAQEILANTTREDLTFDQIYTYSDELKGYVLTQEGLQEWINNLNNNAKVQAEELRKNTELQQAVYKDGFSAIKISSYRAVKDTYDTETFNEKFKAVLATNISQELTDEQLSAAADEYQRLAENFEGTDDEWVEYLEEQGQILAEILEISIPELLNSTKQVMRQALNSFDFEAIAGGTGENLKESLQVILKELLGESYSETLFNNIWTELLKGNFEALNQSLESAGVSEIGSETQDKSKEANIQQYINAIDEILNYSVSQYLSEATKTLITESNLSIDEINNSIEGTIKAAVFFLNQLEDQLHSGKLTLEQYNSSVKSILDKTLFKNGGKQRTLLDFASNDINADSLETFANTLQLKLTDIIDVTTGQVTGGLDQFLSYDIATNTYKIQGTFDDFINALQIRFGIIIDKTSQAYIDILNTYNDSLISENTKIKDDISKELNNLKNLKPKDWLNLTQITSEIKKISKDRKKASVIAQKYLQGQDAQDFAVYDGFFKSFETSLQKMGAYLEDGILKLTDNVDFLGLAQVITNYTLDAGIELSDEIADLMQTILKSYTDAISKGIEGGMSAAERTDLVEKVKSFGIVPEELDFTKTAEGLQLSEESAIKLYHAMSQVDKLQGRILFEKLSKRLVENNAHYKTANSLLSHTYELQNQINQLRDKKDSISQERLKQYQSELTVAKEIAATRLIEENTSWDFTSEDAMPASFSNALNYWGTWVKVQKELNDAATSEQMDPSQFIAVFKHVEELAAAAGHTIDFLGVEVGEGKMTLDILMDQLWDAINYDEKGEAYLAADKLKALGFDIYQGAQGLSDELWEAAKLYGTMNGEQLENIHDFYRNLLTLRRDLGELDFEDFTDQETGAFNIDLLKTKSQKAYNDLMQFGEKVKVNNKDFAVLMEGAEDTWKPGGTNYQLIKSIFNLMSSDNWDVETGYQTIGENLIKAGFEGELDLGDYQFSVKEGKVLTKSSKDEDWQWNGEHYVTSEAAFAAMHNDEVQKIADIQGMTNTINIGGTDFTIEYDEQQSTFQLKSADGTTYESYEKAVTGEYENYLKTHQDSSLSKKAWEIKSGLKIVPTLESQEGILTNEQLELLRQSSITELQKEFGENPLEFKAKYGIDLEGGGDIDWENIKRQIESDATAKSVQVGITNAFTGVNGTEIGTQLGAGIAKALTDIKADVNTDDAKEKLAELKKEAEAAPEPKPISLDNSSVSTIMDTIAEIDAAASAAVTKKVYLEEASVGGTSGTKASDMHATTSASLQLARAKGTLMGELGPEMVVSQGRYFLVGQNGPEMVNLEKDAIVFNHLQTQSLIAKGVAKTRGKAVTNERNAVAYATGSRHGGIAHKETDLKNAAKYTGTLIEIQNATFETTGASPWAEGAERAKNAGINNNNNSVGEEAEKAVKAFIKELERWYNWLQRIAQLDKELTIEEAKRDKIQSDLVAHGQDYYKSQIASLDYLLAKEAEQRDLLEETKAYYKQRQDQLLSTNNPFSQIYRFDETGQLIYQPNAFFDMDALMGKDFLSGNPNNNVDDIYDALVAAGFESYMEYDTSGNKIDTSKDDWKATAVQAWVEKAEAIRQEMQDNYDQIKDLEADVQKDAAERNKILREIRDNQIDVENMVLKAIVDQREAEIENSQKERDAIEKSSNALINGLSEQLNKEQNMRKSEQDKNDLTKLQRQLAILQRSGGSASQIASLQKEITSKQEEAYFTAQQKQIDDLQEAANNQLEKLQQQIDLMTETLAYEKENGLLWQQVFEVMAQNPGSSFPRRCTCRHHGIS